MAWIIHRVEDVTDFIRLKQRDAEQSALARALRSRAGEMEMEIYRRAQEIQEANRQLHVANERLGRLDDIKTRFFSNVSHELRTPLTLILGPADRLLASPDVPAVPRHDIEVIARNARTLLRHVNDLLDVAKLEAGKMNVDYARVDLSHLVRLVASHFETVAADNQIDWQVDTPERITAAVDEPKFERILLNLLSNALKFTPSGGRVRCSLRRDEQGERAIIEVADSGPGVPLGERDLIFQRFHQAETGANPRFGGTGLGLAIARDFVELHRGTIDVTDAPEGGAQFVVGIPLEAPPGAFIRESTSHEDEVAALARALVDGRQQLERGSVRQLACADDQAAVILVVEDNREMNAFIRETLAPEFRTIGAFDGSEGLVRAIEARPDLILSDVMMPQMSGEELVRTLRQKAEFDATPVILLTAKADEHLRVDLLRTGVQDYLMKPFSAEELRARVRNLVAMKRAREVLQVELRTQTTDLETLSQEAVQHRRKLQQAMGQLTANERIQKFLADATTVLSESLDYHKTVARVARLAVPTLADWCFLDLVEDDGSLRRVEVVHADPAKSDVAEAARRFTASTEGNLDHPATRAVLQLSPVLLPNLDESKMRAIAHSHEHFEVMKATGARSLISVPLVAHHHVVGAMTFVDAESGRFYDESDLAIAQDLARRAAMAIENARLYAEAREAVRARDEFLSIASHELKTPLTPLQIQLQTLNETIDRFVKADMRSWLLNRLQMIHRQSERLNYLVTELLDISRIAGGRLQLHPENLDLADVIHDVVADFRAQGEFERAQSDIRVNVCGPIVGHWDRTRIEQVLTNLLSNAVKYGAGKPITLTAACDGEFATLTVTDEGIGIAPEDQQRIFARFERAVSSRHYGGLGLGLFIVREVLEKMGGTIRVRSVPAEGAAFTVILPLQAPPSRGGRSENSSHVETVH